ncbi:MAG: hypothetical protein H0U49_04700 [Parachlamydiaceae bacterium]|nr:hypothetical protein [Parachlamydiaceae bacterium]
MNIKFIIPLMALAASLTSCCSCLPNPYTYSCQGCPSDSDPYCECNDIPRRICPCKPIAEPRVNAGGYHPNY